MVRKKGSSNYVRLEYAYPLRLHDAISRKPELECKNENVTENMNFHRHNSGLPVSNLCPVKWHVAEGDIIRFSY